jgi:hypothetical protein
MICDKHLGKLEGDICGTNGKADCRLLTYRYKQPEGGFLYIQNFKIEAKYYGAKTDNSIERYHPAAAVPWHLQACQVVADQCTHTIRDELICVTYYKITIQ